MADIQDSYRQNRRKKMEVPQNKLVSKINYIYVCDVITAKKSKTLGPAQNLKIFEGKFIQFKTLGHGTKVDPGCLSHNQ